MLHIRSAFFSVSLAVIVQASAQAAPGSAEGQGLFEDAVSTATLAPARSVAIGDVNGDTLNDVILLTGPRAFDEDNSYKLFVYHQGNEGTLLPPVKIPMPKEADMSLDLGDFNSDGRTDVIAGGEFTGGIFYQTTTGSLAAMVFFAPPQAGLVCTGDFNSDGRDDIASLSWANTSVYISLQTPQGSLAPAVEYMVSYGGFGELASGDLNNDGRDDLAIMSGSGNFAEASVFLQTATGILTGPRPYSLVPGVNASGLAIGDVNGDGMHDLLLSNGYDAPTSYISVFEQAPSGGLERQPLNVLTTRNPETVRVADVNRDHNADVIVLYGGGLLGVHTQTTTGSLNSAVSYPLPYATSYFGNSLAVGDINQDGAPDIAVADYLNGLTTLYHTPVHNSARSPWALYE